MKKVLIILPLFAFLTSCGGAKEVDEEAFDEYAIGVTDTSKYTKITAESILKTTGYDYKSKDNIVEKEDTNDKTNYVINKINGEWETDEKSSYVLSFAQENIISNYKAEIVAEKDYGTWRYYLKPASIYVKYEEDQMDRDIKVHIAQTFTYKWDDFGRITLFKITANKICYLNGTVEGYGNTITMDYLQQVKISYN